MEYIVLLVFMQDVSKCIHLDITVCTLRKTCNLQSCCNLVAICFILKRNLLLGGIMDINELVLKAHSAAKAKGWYDKPRELPELLMLIVSELSEALEADRAGKYCTAAPGLMTTKDFEIHVKDTVQDEIADAVIRIADLCGYLDINIEAHIDMKMRYNETRPKKHGKKY